MGKFSGIVLCAEQHCVIQNGGDGVDKEERLLRMVCSKRK